MIGGINSRSLKRRQGGCDGDQAGSWLELVVPAVAGAVRAGAVGAVLQHRRAELARDAVLLLVSARPGLRVRRRDRGGLLAHTILTATVIENRRGVPCRTSIEVCSSCSLRCSRS